MIIIEIGYDCCTLSVNTFLTLIFQSLISIYAELHQAYSRAAEIKVSGKRHLGTYFRVRFYGKKSFE